MPQRTGGYVQNIYQYEGTQWELERRIYFTLGSPTEKLDEFLTGVAGIGRVTARSENPQDMTVQYSDTALRLGKYFETSPEMWLNLQSDYELRKLRSGAWPETEKRIRPLSAA